VRAYDLRTRHLFAKPIVDPSEPDEEMYGVPVTRATSPDGRWAYTLYDSREHPFVHALDTQGRTAVCIDLDDVRKAWGATLEFRGPRLEVVGDAAKVLATIDTRTHRLVEPRTPEAANGSDEDAATSWLPLAAPTAALLLLLAAVGRLVLNRRRREPITEVWEDGSARRAPTA
jgi:hypothetical protein